MAPFKRRTQEGACLCPGVISYIPSVGFSAHDGLGDFGLMSMCALMRFTTSNGVIKSKADTLPAGPSSIFTYAIQPRTIRAGSHPQVLE